MILVIFLNHYYFEFNNHLLLKFNVIVCQMQHTVLKPYKIMGWKREGERKIV